MADLERAAEEISAGLDWIMDIAPGAARSFRALLASSMADAAASDPAKAQALLALAMAAAGRCEECVARHARSAAATGARRDEVIAMLQRAVLMSDGPAAVYAADALAQFDAAKQDAGLAEPDEARAQQPSQATAARTTSGAARGLRTNPTRNRPKQDLASSPANQSYHRLSEAVATARP